MLTFAFLRKSSNLHIYKGLYWERNKAEKNEKLTLNYNKNCSPELLRYFFCVLCGFLTDLVRFSAVLVPMVALSLYPFPRLGTPTKQSSRSADGKRP